MSRPVFVEFEEMTHSEILDVFERNLRRWSGILAVERTALEMDKSSVSKRNAVKRTETALSAICSLIDDLGIDSGEFLESCMSPDSTDEYK